MMPVKPNRPAIMATTKNVTTHPSIPLPPFKLFPLEASSFFSKLIITDMKNKIRKTIKIILAIPTAALITPEKPKMPAIIAMIRKIIDQANIYIIL